MSAEQQAAFVTIRDEPYTFLTGGAGVGKTAVICYALEHIPDLEAVGSTGVAALAISGRTLHSWSSIGLGDLPADVLHSRIRLRSDVCRRLCNSTHLLLDEVSMIDAETLDKIDYILRNIRQTDAPFGGIKVTLCGDLLQLPIVSKSKGFFFESTFWKDAKFKTIYLTEVFRQHNPDFAKVLNKIRLGVVDESVLTFIERIKANKPSGIGVPPVVLHCTNKDVDAENEVNYAKLEGEEHSYLAKDTGSVYNIQIIDKQCPAKKEIKLKEGTQVMLLANVDTEGGLVNGSVGIVDGFSVDGKPIVLFTNGRREVIERKRWEIKEKANSVRSAGYKTLTAREQIPLRKAWSLTIHKCQGATLDNVEIDLSKAFEPGQVYVALSRAKDDKNLFLRAFALEAIKAHPRCLEFYGYDENGIKKPT